VAVCWSGPGLSGPAPGMWMGLMVGPCHAYDHPAALGERGIGELFGGLTTQAALASAVLRALIP